MNTEFKRTLELWDPNPRHYITHTISTDDLYKSFEYLVHKAISLGGQEITAVRLHAHQHSDKLPKLPSIWRRIIRAKNKAELEERKQTDPEGVARDRAELEEAWKYYN